jgi:hypothetical protein
MIMQPLKMPESEDHSPYCVPFHSPHSIFGFSEKSCLDGHGNISSLIQRVEITGLIWWMLVVPCGAMMISGLVSIPTWMNTVDD